MVKRSVEDIREVVAAVTLSGNGVNRFTVKHFDGSEVIFVQHTYLREDAITGEQGWGYGRKWHISPHATDSEIVLTCLKAAITNAEHEVRESFRFMGSPIFQPHQDVYALRDACSYSDARKTPTEETERAEVLG